MAGPRQAKSRITAAPARARILVVEGRYYEAIADALLAGARRVLEEAEADWTLVTVPGALEVPQAVVIALDAAGRRAGAKGRAPDRRRPYDGVVALGCVIRGETSHYDIVAGESARALMDIAVARRVPIGNGILTVDTEAQARVRAAPEDGDKGGVAAAAALALVALGQGLGRPGRRR